MRQAARDTRHLNSTLALYFAVRVRLNLGVQQGGRRFAQQAHPFRRERGVQSRPEKEAAKSWRSSPDAPRIGSGDLNAAVYGAIGEPVTLREFGFHESPLL